MAGLLLLPVLLACSDTGTSTAEGLRFSLPRLDDPLQRLETGDLQLPAVVNLWAAWCVPCRKEVPELLLLAESAQVPVYGLSYRDKPEEARRWLTYYGNPYRDVAFDEAGAGLATLAQAGVPQTFVLDKAGLVRFHLVGPLTGELLESQVLPIVYTLKLEEN